MICVSGQASCGGSATVEMMQGRTESGGGEATAVQMALCDPAETDATEEAATAASAVAELRPDAEAATSRQHADFVSQQAEPEDPVRRMVHRIFRSVTTADRGLTGDDTGLMASTTSGAERMPPAEQAAGQKRKRGADRPAAVTQPPTDTQVRLHLRSIGARMHGEHRDSDRPAIRYLP